ncbi:hypothetical protein VNO77_02304 [Canavalia gladiata]|uniref:Uncharacterized protein n=1 Tax=Canavalia gladiata TaxID=3824 RepID=A0AAN9R741_CANGL
MNLHNLTRSKLYQILVFLGETSRCLCPQSAYGMVHGILSKSNPRLAACFSKSNAYNSMFFPSSILEPQTLLHDDDSIASVIKDWSHTIISSRCSSCVQLASCKAARAIIETLPLFVSVIEFCAQQVMHSATIGDKPNVPISRHSRVPSSTFVLQSLHEPGPAGAHSPSNGIFLSSFPGLIEWPFPSTFLVANIAKVRITIYTPCRREE